MSDTIKFRLTIPSDLPLGRHLSSLTSAAMRHELIRLASNGLAFEGRVPASVNDGKHLANLKNDDLQDDLASNNHKSAKHKIDGSNSEISADDPLVDFGDGLSDYLG
jgi:hypothetical protein